VIIPFHYSLIGDGTMNLEFQTTRCSRLAYDICL
jgi:hypothetical protein